MDDSRFEITGADLLVDSGFLRLERLNVRTPGGDEVGREVVRHPGAVAIVAVVDDAVVLIRQYRAPVDAYVLELPAGKLDVTGEGLEPAAARELEEEVGLRPGRLEAIAAFWTGPGFTDERLTVFVATDCAKVAHAPHGPEEEDAEVVCVPIAELRDMLAADAFEDVKTIVGLQALLQRI